MLPLTYELVRQHVASRAGDMGSFFCSASKCDELQAEYELLQFKQASKASHPTLLFSASFLLQ